MSPALQQTFMTEIAPMLESTVRRVIRPVGSEDADELVQDALAAACQAVDSLERRNRPIPCSSVVHYTLQALKTGRRSQSAGRTDVMSPGCQLDSRSVLESLDAPLTTDDEGGELCLGDVMAHKQDDPGCRAARNLDWSEFVTGLTSRQQRVLWATATGFRGNEQATALKVSAPRITELKRTIAARVEKFWGDAVLRDVTDKPLWRKARQTR